MPRLACALILATAALAGCGPGGSPAAARNLKLTLVADAPAAGGLPAKFTLAVTNASARPVRFTIPRPMCAEAESGAPPFPVLGMGFRECRELYWPMYTDLQAKRVPEADSVVLPPGCAWTHEYALKDFYFWGPCGPASDEDVKGYYKPGKTALHMFAFLGFPPVKTTGREPGELHRADSEPITVRCDVGPEMLKTRGSP